MFIFPLIKNVLEGSLTVHKLGGNDRPSEQCGNVIQPDPIQAETVQSTFDSQILLKVKMLEKKNIFFQLLNEIVLKLGLFSVIFQH